MSDESDAGIPPKNHKGKRKNAIITSSFSDSDSSASNIPLSKRSCKRKNRITESESDSSIETARKQRRIPRVTESESESSDSSQIIRTKRSKRILSDEDSSSSSEDSDFGTDNDYEEETDENWESDWQSGGEDLPKEKEKLKPSMPLQLAKPAAAKVDPNFSDSSDGNSEKCPICLLSFNGQEVGTPETCDHSFCADCIHEWSKNVNTCPVDRLTFTLILVRKYYDGKVVRQISVDNRRASVDELIHEDPTFCEICGLSDREDRLLLCDGCDLGYHLECLEPPLDTVPLEEWFCSECRLPSVLHDQQNTSEDNSRANQHRRSRHEYRLVPRTSQSERVRAMIATNRNSALLQDQASNSSGFESFGGPGPSRTNNALTHNRGTTKSTQKKTKKKRRRTRRKKLGEILRYDICTETGKKIPVRKKSTRRKRKYKRKKVKRVIVPKTVKKRLAIQLGMCPPKKIGQAIPEVKMHTHSNNNINFQRSQAGIPTLHLFGRRDQLDYFSGSEEDMPASYGNVLLQARTASSSATSLRRAARRKAGFIPAPPASVSSCDVLGSILNSQENLYSKNSIITVDSNGTVNIKSKTTNNNNSIIRPNTEQIVTAPELLDLTSNGDHETTQAPMFPGRSGGGNRQPYFNRGGGYRGGGNMYEGGSHYNYQNQGGPRGRGYNNQGMYNHPRENFGYSNYHNVNNHSTPPNYRARGPPRFPVRRPQLQPLVHRQTEELPPIELQLDDSIENAIGNSDSARQEEEVDIYSDIETGSPTQEDPPDEVKSPPMDLQPAAVPLSFSNSVSDEDSDRELVIDDSVKDSDKYDPADPSNDTDSNSQPPKLEKVDEFLRSEEITVPVDEELGTVSVESENISVQSASVNSSAALNLSSIPSVTSQVVDEAVQQVLKEHLGNSTISNIQNDDDFSDEDCPNFSIYSAESIHIAKSTDSNIPKDISDEQSQDDEVIEKVDEMVVNAMEKEEELVEEVEEGIETSESAKEDLIEDEKGFKDDMEVIPNEIENKVDNKEIFEESQNDDEIVRREDITNKDDINVKDSENDQKSDGELDDFSDEEKLEDIFSKEDTVEEKFDDMQNHEKSQELKSTSEPSSTPIKIAFDPKRKSKTQVQSSKSLRVLQLYDDSDLEEWESKNELDKTLKPADKSAENANELDKMTEAISEEERSYTPCLDEKEPLKNQFSDDEHNTGAGIGGMDTEMISEDERNDIFDESHDMKTISDGDALEINAKESELDITRAEDYEEGEIIERVTKKVLQEEQETEKADESVAEEQPIKVPSLTKKKDKEDKEKEPKEKARREENTDKAGKKTEFKKLSKSNKERNYRDKEKERKSSKGKSQERKSRDDKENNRKEKRRDRKRGDLERYSVRSLIQEKPRKDQFGRDETRHRSASRGSQTPSPRRSTSRSRRSASHDRSKKRRRRSRSVRRSRSRSISRGYSPVSRARSLRRSKSRGRSRSNRRSSKSPRNKKSRAYHSTSRDRYKRKKTPDRGGVKPKGKKNRSGSRTRVRSRTPASFTKHRGREWERKQSFSREWTPSWSRSPSPRPLPRHNLPQSMSPSWTPPLAHEKGPVQPENLTVILTNNEVNKKKKDKKKKADKKTREEFKKRKRSERTPPPSKEVFASGDNILVSVSFNKTGDDSTVGTREVMGVKRKRETLTESLKKQKKDRLKEKKKRGTSPKAKKKKNKEIANMKPVAIIDLDRSPFKELTPSPKDIIVLSDSDNCEKGDESMGHIQEEMTTMEVQNQEDSAPQSPNNYLNSTGPKTPPEPQIKFLLSSKQNQIRVISNPLHDPTEEVEAELDPQEELEQRLNDVLHKGPNTPPDPPISPPSSPDAYDPFDPTKSPSPEPQTNSQISIQKAAEKNSENENDLVDLAVGPLELSQKSVETGDKRTSPNNASSKRLSLSPDRTSQTRERTSPSDSQQIDSEPTKNESSDKVSKSPPERTIGVVINQQVQQTSIFPTVVKPISTSVYSSVTPAIITSTPTLSNSSLPRTNLFNTPSLNTPRIAQSAVPQRIILPTPSKSSPAKMSPAKPPIKSTPIKPMPSSKTMISKLPVPNVKPITPMRKGNQSKPANRNQNGNEVIDVDMDFESPYSPGSSDYEDLFEPPVETSKSNNNNRQQKNTKSPAKQNVFDNLFGSTSPVYRPPAANKGKQKSNSAKTAKSKKTTPSKHASNKTHVGVKLDEDNLKILDDLPNSAVEMQVKDKFLKKLNRQERVVEEVKLVLKPHYNKKHVTKEQYKDILRRSVPKICHNKSGEINPKKIQNLIEAYVKKARHNKKLASGANPGSQNIQPKPAKTTFWS